MPPWPRSRDRWGGFVGLAARFRQLARLVVAVVTAALLVPAAAAGQEPAPERPSCPTPPLAYAGSDDVVREVRLGREDARTVCLAARSDADAAHTDHLQAHADAVVAHDDAVAQLQATNAPPAPGPGSTLTAAAIVAEFKPHLDAGVIALGVLAGFGVVGLLMPAIRRFWP